MTTTKRAPTLPHSPLPFAGRRGDAWGLVDANGRLVADVKAGTEARDFLAIAANTHDEARSSIELLSRCLRNGYPGESDVGRKALREANAILARMSGTAPTETAPGIIEEVRAAVLEIKAWNDADIRGFDEITPNLPMLRARRKVIRALLAKLGG